MTAIQSRSLDTAGVRSLEVRWIIPGQLATAVAGWFGRFPAETARVPGLGEEPGWAVELTEVRTRGEAWWTVGFEATGPARSLRSELEAAAALVFAHDLPGGMELGMDDSRSYAQWLRRRQSAGSDATT